MYKYVSIRTLGYNVEGNILIRQLARQDLPLAAFFCGVPLPKLLLLPHPHIADDKIGSY